MYQEPPLTKSFPLIFVLIVTFITHSAGISNEGGKLKNGQCPAFVNCVCHLVGNDYSIKCINITTDELRNMIDNVRFVNTSVYRLWILESHIPILRNNFFSGIRMRGFILESSDTYNVEEETFYNLQGTSQIGFINSKLQSMPYVFGPLKKTLNSLIFKRGDLQAIGTQLQNLTSLTKLTLSSNHITEVHKDAFSGILYLQYLDMSKNNISYLDPSLFRDQKFLQIVKLSHNRLKTIDELFEFQLLSLKELHLDWNQLTSIENCSSGAFKHLKDFRVSGNLISSLDPPSFNFFFPHLQYLDISNNTLKHLPYTILNRCISMSNLVLSKNDLQQIDNRTFSSCRYLKNLDLSSNKLKTIEGLLTNTKDLRLLVLSNNQFSSFDNYLLSLKRLRSFIFSWNTLVDIPENSFVRNKDLRILNFQGNHITRLYPKSFAGLSKIRILFLRYNNLKSLNRSISNLTSLELLDLSYNRLEVLVEEELHNLPKLFKLLLMKNRLFSVEGAFASLKSLTHLSLKGNMLEILTRESLVDPKHLRYLDIGGNPVNCDCRFKWLLDWLVTRPSAKNSSPVCSKPEWLSSRPLFTLNEDDLLFWKKDCPPETCNCLCHANRTDIYIEAICSGKNLTELPIVVPEKLAILDVTYNSISVVDNSTCNLFRLESLNVEHNILSVIKDIDCLGRLQRLFVANNNLKHVDVLSTVSKVVTLEEVTVSNNPWQCTCDNWPFVNWIASNRHKVLDINDTKCVVGTPEASSKRRLRLITDLEYNDLCPNFVLLYTTTIASTLGFLLIISLVIIGYNRYNLHIKIWMYYHGYCTCIKEEDIDTDKTFDVFISYSNVDYSFVIYELLPNLECNDAEYRTCIHDRDFIPGIDIEENIINAIKCSRRTLVVLSKDFTQSEWCRKEFKFAYQQFLQDKMNRLIVLLYGELPPIEEQDDDIKVYLQSTNYLKWGEKYFWQKLFYALPKKGKPPRIRLSVDIPERPSEVIPLGNCIIK